MDKEAIENGCVKDFVKEKSKTGGLEILTCCCPKKRILGFCLL